MLTKTTRLRSTSHRGWILLCTGLIAAGVAALLRWLLAFGAGHATAPPAAVPPIVPGELQMAAAQRGDVGDDAVQRHDAAPGATEAPAAEPLSFERQIEHLARLQQELAAAVQDDEIERAKAADQEARLAFDALLQQFPDAGERSLTLLAGAPPDRARLVVLQLVIAAECLRRHAAADAEHDRKHLDALVGALLASMPRDEGIAALGEAVLDGKPYLRLVHEPAVLDLVRGAGEGRLPRRIATRLLRTLWDNLWHSGERPAGELVSRALFLLTDADASKRTAACGLLLGDPAHRQVVLAWLREQKDATVATEVAALAAQQLPPTEALAVLRELAPTLPDMPAAYLALGQRAPDVLADAYHELLAADTQPAVRRDLIAGLAMTRAPAAAAAVGLALQTDPSPEVRLQAMLATTATAPERGEAACHTILDDPGLGGDPARLAVVVLALQNLEAAGLTNAIDRLGQRLRNTPLRDDSRRELELLLARALPNGRTSR